jgi:hypothetical protein
MAKDPYLPASDNEKSIWLNSFSSQFVSLGLSLGFTPEEITAVVTDANAFSYAIALVEAGKNYAQQCTAFKDDLRDGAIGATPLAFPVFIAPVNPPTAVATGIFKRIAAVVKRIKSNSLYTEAMGKSLGIVGTEVNPDLSDAKPVLAITQTGGKVVIKYTKGYADGLRILSKRGSETNYSLLTIVTKNTFEDTRPNLTPGQPEVRYYTAYYLQADVVVGLVSDVVTVTVL